ncbi:site-specific integrase [Caenispirillum salinarum]|uniref:site-specific integrase n=1 Tax=Caenispirillum salinarum TaxID=859058 RepID=UPI0005B977E7|nr:site-specific integrase [Caenispirillum salinarum]
MPEHVFRRGAVYHWRRRIPSRLREAGDPAEIQLSLHTRCLRTARARAARVAAVFAHVAYAEEDSQPLRIPPDPADRIAALLPAADPEPASLAHRLVRLLRAAIAGAVDLVQRLVAPPLAEPPQPQAAAPTPPTPVPAETLRRDVALPDLFAACVESKGQTEWTGKTVRDADRAVALFTEMIGERTARGLTAIDASDFQRLLGRLPAWHGRSIYKGLTGPQSIAKADRLETLVRRAEQGDAAAAEERDRMIGRSEMAVEKLLERLHPKTNNKHVGSLRAIFAFAEEHHYRAKDTNPFAGLFFSKAKMKKNQRRRRDVWSDDDLVRLFASPLYQGHGDARHEPGARITKDALYWAPLLAGFNGLRLEEALRIPVNAVMNIGGAWCLRIQASETQRLKTEASERTVPLHPLLVDLGLPEHAAAMRARGHKAIFPELRPGGPDNTLGYQFSKVFGSYRKRIGLDHPGRDFHALRKTFNTSIQRKHRSDAGRHYLLGHEHGGVNYEHYFSGFEVADLLPYLEDVHYAGDVRRALAITEGSEEGHSGG